MFKNLARRIYNSTIRPYLPYKFAVYNGVPVFGTIRLLDFTDEIRDYKEANVNALREHVENGDRVLIIGGGIGVTAVIAARQTGLDGVVTIYEASVERTGLIQDTLETNKVGDICDVSHSIVGPLQKSNGELGTPEQVSPSELSECDVLEVDCEGAESEVISDLSIEPRVIIVETHPKYGSPTEDVKELLRSNGYQIINEAEDPVNGHILTANRKASKDM